MPHPSAPAYLVHDGAAPDAAGVPAAITQRQDIVKAPTPTIEVDHIDQAMTDIALKGGQQGRVQDIAGLGRFGYAIDSEGNIIALLQRASRLSAVEQRGVRAVEPRDRQLVAPARIAPGRLGPERRPGLRVDAGCLAHAKRVAVRRRGAEERRDDADRALRKRRVVDEPRRSRARMPQGRVAERAQHAGGVLVGRHRARARGTQAEDRPDRDSCGSPRRRARPLATRAPRAARERRRSTAYAERHAETAAARAPATRAA